MTRNQCVPNWDVDHDGPTSIPHAPPPHPPPPPPPSRSLNSRSTSLSGSVDISTFDYEMAELTWENGQLAMHGLGLPRVPSKNNLGGAWTDKQFPRASGTLESIVNQATLQLAPPFTHVGACKHDNLVPWFDPECNHYALAPASVSKGMDALVPSKTNVEQVMKNSTVASSTRVESCSNAVARVPPASDWSVSASESERWHSVKRAAEDTCEQLRSTTTNGMTSTSVGASLDNTKTITVDDHDSACHSRPTQREEGDDEEENQQKKGRAKSSASTKRSRVAAVHNQSERKRRDKINQRMKTLQKLVPNSNKTDKASMLDEVIDYLKELQAQVQMLNRMSLPSMMMPLAIQQQLQMSMMGPMGMGMGLGFGMGMDHMNMNVNGRPNIAGLHPAVLNPTAYMTLASCTDGASVGGGDRISPPPTVAAADPWSAYLACQSNPMTMDAYSRMAVMYQQLQLQQQLSQHQQPGPNSKHLG